MQPSGAILSLKGAALKGPPLSALSRSRNAPFKTYPREADPMRNFAEIRDLSRAQLIGLLRLARELQQERETTGRNRPLLQGRHLSMIFMKPSLRTRVSFETGMQQLGGHASYLSPAEVGMGTRETPADVARVLSGYTDGIMARVFEHEHIEELIRHADVPVINGLSDASHPCQALADVYTMARVFGPDAASADWPRLVGLKVVYVGDGDSNVARSLIEAGQLVGLDLRVVAPSPYQPQQDFLERIDADVAVTADLDGVAEADVVYTDVFVSMGQDDERDRRLRDLAEYIVDENLLQRTGNREVVVMHCLPAHRGEEITDQVMDGPHSRVFEQAHNRLHAQKAMLAHLLGDAPLP